MGNLICTCLSSSRGNTSARISDSSTWSPQTDQHISIRTFRELNQAQTSSPTSTRTETPSNGERFRSTEDLQEEDSRQQTTLTRRSASHRQLARGSYST
ncbi:C4 protein [Sida yellow vein Madurai virus]|uniref:C4 protein n=1 Tax=Sida yellow vein Madurai virus TaxID=420255 RepID=Q17ZQ7_9GEMI|nr:C4 protein [Sida yellow vein Madurai virus]CAJ90740.1 C4 protein [Sida yellow vein Madurai virus]